MLLSEGIFALPGITLLRLVQCLASVANWWGVHVAMQIISITSTADICRQAHAGVSQRRLWENHALPSFHYCKGPDQWRVSPSQCWKLRKSEFDRHLRPCAGKSFSCWCCSVKASKNPIVTRNQVACSSSQQEWAGDWTNLAMLEDRAYLDPSSMSCQSCQLTRHSCSNPAHIHHQYCWKGTHVEPFSPELPIWQRVRSMKSVSFAMLQVDKAWRFFGCWCRLLTSFRNPLTRNHVVCSSSEQECAKDWTNFAMLKEQTFALVQCLSKRANWWGIVSAIQFIYQLPSLPVPSRDHTCRCQAVTTVREPKSPQLPFLQRVRSMKSVSFAMLQVDKAWRLFGCWCRLLTSFRNPCVTRNHGACSSSEQECAKDWTNLAMLEVQTFALVQCLSSLANWWGVRAAMQFIAITSAEERADMQVSASDHCERTILFTALCFNLAKDQINEGEKAWVWKKPQTLCWDEPLVADAAVIRLPGILSLPGITLPNIELLPCWQNGH